MKALSNTQFQKCGSRVIVHLIGVLCPAVWQRPLFYTVFENQVQGADMICSMMVDVLVEATTHLGCLPKRLVFQADNTPKEIKNTITLATAVWLLAQLQHTRLQVIEFCYLVVGHTHDLIDAVFAFVSRALHAKDVLSLPDMFSQLNAKMKRPPMWKHLRDVWGFKDSRPKRLTADTIKGITLPNHVRVFWSQDGSICLQAKRWITSAEWSKPVVLCEASEVPGVREWWAPPLTPSWPHGFVPSCLTWLDKLQGLLEQSGRDCNDLKYMRQLVQDELPEYLPTGRTLESRLQQMRKTAAGHVVKASLDENFLSSLGDVIAAAFPSHGGGGQFCVLRFVFIFKVCFECVTSPISYRASCRACAAHCSVRPERDSDPCPTRQRRGDWLLHRPLRSEYVLPLQETFLKHKIKNYNKQKICLYRNRASRAGVPCDECPVRIGKVARISNENDPPIRRRRILVAIVEARQVRCPCQLVWHLAPSSNASGGWRSTSRQEASHLSLVSNPMPDGDNGRRIGMASGSEVRQQRAERF